MSDAAASFAGEMTYIFHQHESRNGLCGIDRLTIRQAYEVQENFLASRIREGARIVGWKVGCTSAAIRRQFGLSQPICGRLLEPDVFADGVRLPISRFVDCAVEPELVFRMGADLTGDEDSSQLRGSIAAVTAGIELHNYRFWLGRPTSQELIASNGIHAGLVIGQQRPLARDWDMDSEEVSISVNGKTRASGRCSEIMGGPLLSLQWLAKHASSVGQPVRAGQWVIPGSAVELVRVHAGDEVEARFATLGSCFMRLI